MLLPTHCVEFHVKKMRNANFTFLLKFVSIRLTENLAEEPAPNA